MLCLLLAAMMLLTVLSACGKDDTKTPGGDKTNNEPGSSTNNGKNDNKDNNQSGSGYETLAQKTGFGYVASYKPLEGDYQWAYGLQMGSDGRLMMRSNTHSEEDGYQEVYLTMNPDGSDIKELPMPTLGENEGIQNMCIVDDGMWLVTYEWISSGASGGDMVVYDTATAVVAASGDTAAVQPADETPATADDAAPADWTQSTEGDENPGQTDPGDIDWIDKDDPSDDPSVEPGGDSGEIYRLYKVDFEGNVVLNPDISAMKEGMDYFYVNNMFADNEGRVYLLCDSILYRVDNTGKIDGKLEFENWVDNAVATADGRILIAYYGDESREMRWLNTDTMELGDKLNFGSDVQMDNYNFVVGGGNYDLYMDDSNELYGYNIATGEITELLNWMDSDVDKYSMNGYYVVDEETILFIYNEDGSGVELGTLKRTPYDQIPQRTVLTIGGYYLNYDVRRLVSKFNRTNEQYRITFVDYSKYSTDDNYQAGIERLNMDMASGAGPDILIMNGSINVDNYVAKGLLADLYPLMEKEGTWSKDDLMEGYRRSNEVDGKLYQLSGNFSFSGLWTSAANVDEQGNMSLDSLLAACQNLDEDGVIMPYTTKNDALSQILATSYDDLIDPLTGECHFDTPEFIKLLQYVNCYPDEIDWDTYTYDSSNLYGKICSGQQIFRDFYFYSFQDLNYTLYSMGGMKDGVSGAVCVGYPGVSGSKFVMQSNSGLAINANSKYPDACWSLVSQLLSDDYQNNYSWQLSVRKDLVEKQAQDAMQPPYYTDENGNKVEYEQTTWVNGEEVKMEPLTQEQVDYFMNIINSVDGSYNYDDELVTVVSEEAAAFFAGQKSAEEVAKLIQSRVQIYVNEQR